MLRKRRTLRPDEPLRLGTHGRPVTRRDFLGQGLATGLGLVTAPTLFGLFANPRQAAAALSPDIEALKRTDDWQRIFHPRGVIAAASLDPEHWLCFGLGEKLPVALSGGFAYMSKHPVAAPARLAAAAEMRLSGLLWPEARERLAGTAYATVERVGAGQIILFATDPFFRGYFEGSGRLLLNAVVLGPGMGVSSPVPW